MTATRAVGAEAVTITGNAPVAQPLEAVLYATFSQNLPTVLLSRRAVPTDSLGRFNATLPIAPAFFRNAIVTVVVHSLPAGPSARATITVGAAQRTGAAGRHPRFRSLTSPLLKGELS